ncbi:MAG: sugar nucleotide-binding protein [Gemmatimonadota bacterium]|nr:sugar nucleotide-binding protein [Gemmatimonadota bacterium]
MRPRILITGASGFLGSRLWRQAHKRNWDVSGTYFSKPPPGEKNAGLSRLDLKSDTQAADLVDRLRPEVVVHTAYSQSEREVIFQGTRRLAGACARLEDKPYFIFLSTDLVFDGGKGNYCEEDQARPVMGYGRDKLEAEAQVRSLLPGSLVVRTSLLYDLIRVPSHLRFALEAEAAGRSYTFFRDEYRSPMLVDELARALLELAVIRPRGLLHVAGRDRVDRFLFGTALMKALGYGVEHAVAGSFQERGLSRPPDCSLDSSRAGKLLGRQFSGAGEVLGG